MNIILIISDTLRRDHLGCYGNPWISTPNIDGLARKSMVFDRAYAASFPTVPHRRDVFTGRFSFTYSDWSPLSRDEVVLAQVLHQAGYATMLIADTPHILKDGYHFDRGFDGWKWIRGQENDRYITDPIELKFPCNPDKLRSPYGTVVQYLRNISRRRHEGDYFVAKTMTRAAEWLERNRDHGKFFLCVDTFDPHEPWDPPSWYVELYESGYQGEEVIYPVYGPCDYLTAAELKHMRALYAGEVTLVDRWTGMLLRRVEELGLWKNTVIIFTTDHGFYHGEHGLVGKSIITSTAQGLAPLYEEVARIPLMIRLPNEGVGRCQALVQPPDLMPTILELAGAKVPETVQGGSLLPLLRGEEHCWRDFAVTSPSLIHGPVAGQRITVSTDEWSLVYSGQVEDALRELPSDRKLKIVDGIERLQKIFGGKPEPQLYHLPTDPKQEHNVLNEHREKAEHLHSKLVKFLEAIKTPEEYLRYWRKI